MKIEFYKGDGVYIYCSEHNKVRYHYNISSDFIVKTWWTVNVQEWTAIDGWAWVILEDDISSENEAQQIIKDYIKGKYND